MQTEGSGIIFHLVLSWNKNISAKKAFFLIDRERKIDTQQLSIDGQCIVLFSINLAGRVKTLKIKF